MVEDGTRPSDSQARNSKGTRLIVKNLPKHATESRVRSFMGQLGGTITDVKIMKTATGVNRRFAFVGYKTEEEAARAREYFDRSFLDTSKLEVEFAVPRGSDKDLPRPWSRHSAGSSANERIRRAREETAVQEDAGQAKKRHLENSDRSTKSDRVSRLEDESSDEEYQDFPGHNAAVPEPNAAVPEPNAAVPEPKTAVAEQQKPVQSLENGRLFVRNLPYTTTEKDLSDLFSPFGDILEVHLAVDKENKRNKGFAFVLFSSPTSAIEAYSALDGNIFQGRLIHILPARDPLSDPSKDHSTSDTRCGFQSTFQAKKSADVKRSAMRDYNWNSLFIRPDAIAQAMADRHHVEKSDILDKEQSGSMAVTLALGETSIIQETKEFLESQGVCSDTLKSHYDPSVKRSSTTIIIKNIPATAQLDELRSLFEKHGTLSKIILPPSKTMAIVEFFAPGEARSAFRSLAYKNFHSAPLFLEWAPEGLLNPSSQPAPSQPSPRDLLLSKISDSDQPDQKSNVLFIKNLSFSTEESALSSFISSLVAPPKHVSIARKLSDGKKLSQGFGFAEFHSREQALSAWKKLQGSVLDGHELRVNFSNNSSFDPQNSKQRKRKNQTTPPSTKLLIKNVPFQTNKKEIQELFSPFGEIKKVRLPKKSNGRSHRGFSFVEFLTKDDARNAMTSLENTHLYGRRLVIEYAKDDESIEAIRSKTSKQFVET
ncbi:probable RNA-binding protein 19 [Schistocerca gregaria]|uniref:probable RNA-binding protein 19 n=1 Tax=Schistocerca gregaria TaxID=7010 RepID=UPI00211E34C8|nr:probable RNA-binding protein 19 [Schistocerca gregaria]